jgi:hypothetical protein
LTLKPRAQRAWLRGEPLGLSAREYRLLLELARAPGVVVSKGVLANRLEKSLPGDFMVSFSNESYVDPRGNLNEGRGMPPDIALQVFDPLAPASLSTGHAAAIDQVLALIFHHKVQTTGFQPVSFSSKM